MASNLDRRQFLGQTAVTGAAVGVAMSGATSLAASSPSNKVVVGVMGLSRGRSLTSTFAKLKGVEVKYACDVDIDRAGKGADSLGKVGARKPEAITDFRRILDDSDVDVLICAAPNHWHAPATILGCSAGKHVYVEKPCSHNPWEGETMVAAARKYKQAVQMGSQRRSAPGTVEAIRQLHAGAIGRPYLSRSWYANLRGPIGIGKPAAVPGRLNYDLWQGPAPRMPYVDNRVHYNWHWSWHWGNGELGNNGVHTLDLSRWGLQVDYPTRVTSSGGRYRFDDDQQTPDTHAVCYEFEGEKQITWEGLSCNKHSGGFVTFYGEGGSMELDAGGTFRIYDLRDKLVKEEKSSTNGEAEHVANFIAAIRNDKPLELNAEIETGHKSTLLCHLGNIAHRTGDTLNCDSKNGHINDNAEAMKLWKRDYEPGWEPKI